MRASLPLMVAALLGVSACNSGSDDRSVADESTATRSIEPSDSSKPPNRHRLPDPIANAGPRSPLGDVLTAVQPLPGDPDWLASAAGQLWVKRDDGQVSQVDLHTAKAVGEWSTGYSGLPTCQGLLYDGTDLWSCAGENRLARHEPSAGGAADQFRVARLSDQTRFVLSDDLLWVINAEATGLSGIDRISGRSVRTIDLGTFCIDLARPLGRDRGVVYALCPTDGLVLAVDLAAGNVTGRLRLADARAATIADDLWVAFTGGLAQVDPATLEVVAVYDVNLGLEGEIWADSHDVWARAPGRELLTHIDPRKQRFVETFTSSTYLAGGDILVIGDDLWTTASDDGVLLKVNLP